jgi:hypothetical protein
LLSWWLRGPVLFRNFLDGVVRRGRSTRIRWGPKPETETFDHESALVARCCSPAKLLGFPKLVGTPRCNDARRGHECDWHGQGGQAAIVSYRTKEQLRRVSRLTGGMPPEMMGYSKAPDELCLPTVKRARSRSLHPLQHYQRCRQTQNCQYEKYLRRGRHLCQKLNHLPPPLLGDLGAEQWR